jgi:DNA-binding IclR family transcriptional regulator
MIEETELTAYTEKTVTDRDRLKKELRLIRDRGFAFSNGEYEQGAAAIAAPVFDYKGKVAAGISIVGPRERLLGEKKRELIDMVIQYARHISSSLGSKHIS